MRSLLIAACLCAALPAQREIWASPTGDDSTGDGSQTTPFRTITRCLAAAATSGDTIRLAAGTYGDAEQVRITKSVTIRGVGVGQSIVHPHATLFFTLPGGTPPGTPEDHAVGVLVDGAVRVDLQDLTIDNSYRVPATSRRSYNVMFLAGADGTVQGCELLGARDNPLTTSDAPAAVMVRGDGTSDPCQVTVRACRITDFGKAGVLALYDSAVRVEENDIAGAGPISTPALAQLGVQIGFGATGAVLRNRIADCELTSGAGIGVGVQLLDAAAGVVIAGNRIVRCERGIEAVLPGPTTRALSVRDNVVSESDVGVYLDHDGATVRGNTLHRARLQDARDDTGTPTANVWVDNSWTQWNGVGSKTIAGLSALSDASPRRGLEQFAPTTAVSLGVSPVDVVSADFDASRADFATVNAPASGAAPTLAVGLQTATDVFTVSSLSFAAIGAQPTALAVGEFNGSAGLDLAAVTDESRFYVFANDGNGVFTLLHSAALPASVVGPVDLAAGDVDGDGRDDLAVAATGGLGAGSGVVLKCGTGGTTWTAVTLPTTFVDQCKGVALGRVDAGTSVDLVLSEGTGSAGVVHVYANDGTGVFTELVGSPITVSADPTACAIDDVDLDGDADLLVTCANAAVPVVPGSLHVLRQETTGFVGRRHRVGRLPLSVAGLDLGADADPDTTRRDVLFVSVGDNALGSLDAHERVGFTANLTGIAGAQPRALAVRDMNGDGADDVVVADFGGQAVQIARARIVARADRFGAGCHGTAGRLPYLAPAGGPALPRQPNSAFGLELHNAREFAVGVLLGSTQAPTTLTSCSFLLPSIDLTWLVFTDVRGEALTALSVPAAPTTLVGLQLWFQAVVLDPEGGMTEFLSATEGLRLRVGH